MFSSSSLGGRPHQADLSGVSGLVAPHCIHKYGKNVKPHFKAFGKSETQKYFGVAATFILHLWCERRSLSFWVELRVHNNRSCQLRKIIYLVKACLLILLAECTLVSRGQYASSKSLKWWYCLQDRPRKISSLRFPRWHSLFRGPSGRLFQTKRHLH